MPRIALGVEYDGTRFCGWQRQDHCESVQGALERALSVVANEAITVHCAGRTDTGVHGTGQVVHFNCAAERPPDAWILGGNSNLPDDVAIRWSREVGDDFHARFDAIERRYRYLILTGRSRSALYAHRAWWIHERLDAEAMQAASVPLLGEHDFTSFRAAGCQSNSPIRDLRQIRVRAHGDWIVVDVAANAFLMHMVRNMVGLLRVAGRGEADAAAVADILAARDRTLSAAAAPSCGLYLTEVHYPESRGVPCPVPDDALAPTLPLIPRRSVTAASGELR
ncbi:MAG: tRNA pseudouridine(38-40) synthase TruA [Pseudomonadota bacterium]